MNFSKILQLVLISLSVNNLTASHFIPKFALPKSITLKAISPAIRKVTLPYALGMAAYIALAHKDSAKAIYIDVKYAEKNIKINRPASPEVTKFVTDRLIKHGLDPKNLRIDVRPIRRNFHLGVNGLRTLLMTEDIHDEIHELVTKANLQPHERERLLCYVVKIDHEVSHMKHDDDNNCARARILTTLALQGLCWGAAKFFKFSHYFEPSYIAQAKPSAKLETCAWLALLGFAQGVAYKIIMEKYILFVETRADQFAFEAAETAETLHAYRKVVRRSQDRNIKQFARMAVSIVDASDPCIETFMDCSNWQNFKFRCYVQDLYRTYKWETPKAQQSFTDFETWLTMLPDFAHRVGKITDPTYPSTQETLKTIKKLLKKF